MINGIAGVIVWTGDLERLVKFYRDTLDLPVHSERPYFVAFEWGDMRFSIGTHEHVKGQTQEPYRVMINFGVGDIHAVHKKLTERGVEFIRPPEREHWGGWVATLHDPDGNTIQLLQQPSR